MTLSDIINYGYIFTGFGSVAFVAVASVAMIRTGEVSGMLGQLGLIVAVIQVAYLLTAFFNSGLMVGGGIITIAGFALVWALVARSFDSDDCSRAGQKGALSFRCFEACMEAERRQVTVLFTDMVGFTSFL